jgi:hypothetical protein
MVSFEANPALSKSNNPAEPILRYCKHFKAANALKDELTENNKI